MQRILVFIIMFHSHALAGGAGGGGWPPEKSKVKLEDHTIIEASSLPIPEKTVNGYPIFMPPLHIITDLELDNPNSSELTSGSLNKGLRATKPPQKLSAWEQFVAVVF